MRVIASPESGPFRQEVRAWLHDKRPAASDVAHLAASVVIADQDDWNAEQLGAVGITFSDSRLALVAAVDGLELLGRVPFHAVASSIDLELLSSGATGAPKRLPLTWAVLQGVARQIPVRTTIVQDLPRSASMKVSIPEVKALFEAKA